MGPLSDLCLESLLSGCSDAALGAWRLCAPVVALTKLPALPRPLKDCRGPWESNQVFPCLGNRALVILLLDLGSSWNFDRDAPLISLLLLFRTATQFHTPFESLESTLRAIGGHFLYNGNGLSDISGEVRHSSQQGVND